MESEGVRPGVKQTFTWSTPFFDLTFVDIKTKKGNNCDSSSHPHSDPAITELDTGDVARPPPRT